MNRVRIRYPWQADGEDASPWIRMALPMASGYSGFNFVPEVDDEVMVDFENGNVERPYVIGALYNTEHKPKDYYSEPTDYSGVDGETRSITSRNGHRIIFSDPASASSFFNSFFPLGSILGPVAGTIGSKLNLTSDEQKKLAGGIELTDEYGMYSIKMSSHARDISIASPFGTVNVNAFKGITINAPNGEVSIKGKNISIEAGNNLTLKSGANIAKGWILDKTLKESGEDLLKTGISAAMDFLSGRINILPVDLALMRCVLEAIIRPIGGTMLIKSHRYMCLEAGEGKATIQPKRLSESVVQNIGASLKGSFTGDCGGNIKKTDKERVRGMILNIGPFIESLRQAYITDWDFYDTYLITYREMMRLANASLQAWHNRNANNNLRDNYANDNIGPGNNFADVIDWFNNNVIDPGSLNGNEEIGLIHYDAGKEIAKAIHSHAQDYTMKKIYKDTLSQQNDDTREFLDYDLHYDVGREILANNIYWKNIHRVTSTDFDNFDANKLMSPDIKKRLMGCALEVIYEKITGEKDPTGMFSSTWEEGVDKFVAAMTMTEKTKVVKALTTVKDSQLKTIDGFIDQKVWGNADAGDLLISTKEKTTVHVKDKSIDEYVLSSEKGDWDAKKDELLRSIN
jgi:hypothetical protein